MSVTQSIVYTILISIWIVLWRLPSIIRAIKGVEREKHEETCRTVINVAWILLPMAYAPFLEGILRVVLGH